MSEHTKRAEERAKNKDPINFTCGVCKKIHPFVDDQYECPDETPSQFDGEAVD